LHFFALYQEIHPPQEVNPDFFNEIKGLERTSHQNLAEKTVEN